MVVSFGEVVNHPDDKASGVSDARGKHLDDKASGMSSARGEYPGDEASEMRGAPGVPLDNKASGMRGAPSVPGPAGYWAWSYEGPWAGWLANGTGPGPMVPTIPPFFLSRERSPPVGKITSLTVASLGTIDNQCCPM